MDTGSSLQVDTKIYAFFRGAVGSPEFAAAVEIYVTLLLLTVLKSKAEVVGREIGYSCRKSIPVIAAEGKFCGEEHFACLDHGTGSQDHVIASPEMV